MRYEDHPEWMLDLSESFVPDAFHCFMATA